MLKVPPCKGLPTTIALMIVATATCLASVTTGIPPYQSFGGGPDVINLGNLNVHYSIPVFSRAGRGTPFSYALAYDSSIWSPSTAWIPNSNWGLNRDTAALVGYVFYNSTHRTCNDPYGGTGDAYTWHFTGYVDPAGTWHSIDIATNYNDCAGTDNSTGTAVASDGSGITVNTDWGAATVILKSGEVITPQMLSGGSLTGNGSSQDSNGNQIISATVSGTTTFTDTLGTTALTITGTAPSPVYYKYTAPSGVLASVTVTYKSYTIQTAFGCSGINEYGPLSNSLVDKVTLADGSYYQFGYETTPGDAHSPHYVTGRIASLRLPTGGTISYNYTGGNNGIMCSDGSTAGFDRTTPDGTWHYVRSGTSPAYTTTITTPTDPKTSQTNQTVINFQGNYEVGRLVYQGAASGTALETTYTCYNGNGVATPSSCVTTPVTAPFSQITKFRQLNGGPFAEGNALFDGYGNATEADEYDFGASTPTRKTTTLYGSYVSSTDTCASLSNKIVDHLCKVTVTDSSGNLKAKTTYGYDETAAVSSGVTTNHVSVTGSRGNVTTVSTSATSTTTLTRTLRNYDTGNVYQSQDVNGQWTTYTYGACAGAFPTNVSMPLSLSKSSTWNCTGGVMTSATDENGKISYVNYTTDTNFWRPESTKDALLNITNLTYASLVKSEGYLNFNGAVSTVDVLKQLDSLGRSQYTQQKQSQTATNYDTAQQIYDSFGRPYQVTMPYVATSASPGAPGGTPIASTSYYDALGRPIQTVDGGGGQLNLTYTGRDVYQEIAPVPIADTKTKRKQFEYDGLGRLISVCELTGGANKGPCLQDTPQNGGYRTVYIYDTAPNVNSLTVTQNVQAGGGTSQTRTYIYDMLGRLTQETNPETGTTSYVYDTDGTCTGSYSTGNMVKRTDAVGNVTCYTYDQLHRLLSITYPSGSYATNTDKKYFVYDAATVGGATMQNPKGRLVEAYTCPATGSCTTKKTDLGFSYSARGELATVYEKTPNSGATYYQASASYWAHGGINSLSSNLSGLPNITYGGLDGEGRIIQVTASSGQSPLVSAVNYTTSGTTQPIGSLTQVTFGSVDYDTFSYDPNTGRLNQYKFSVGATPQTVTGNLTWNPNGSLGSLAITDQLNSANTQTCNYSHDDLGRIATANCGTPWNQTFSFDPFGNISKSATAGISFLPTYSLSTNRYASVPGCAPSYDANGFATNDCAHTYSWDSAGNPRTIDGVSLTYDALGRMVEQASGSVYTQIVYGPGGDKLALMNGQTLAKAFVALPAGGAAVYTSTGLIYYRHSDWLGSGRLATTPTRTMYFDVAYGPYGESYAPSGSVSLNFTGQNQDTVSGLYDFLFREYNANQGRWPWPDPAGIGAVSMGNPQTWNRYAYVGNTPLTSVDALGLLSKCSDACRFLRDMAHSAGWFGRFEFFSLHVLGWNGEDWVGMAWGGFVGPVPVNLTVIVPVLGIAGPAVTVTYLPQTNNLCVAPGLGASVGRNVSAGPLFLGNLANAKSITEGPSISVGAQALPILGAQATGNQNGILGGPTVGIPGGSVTATYGICF
jgi:RHS repeat-associated protein